jgi:hypothetical protein
VRTSLIGAHADHRLTDFRFSRTQREAGIEHLEWEDRLSPPLKPFSLYVAAALFWLLFVTAVFSIG